MADEGAYTLRNDIRVAYLSQTTDIDNSKIVLDAVFSEECDLIKCTVEGMETIAWVVHHLE